MLIFMLFLKIFQTLEAIRNGPKIFLNDLVYHPHILDYLCLKATKVYWNISN